MADSKHRITRRAGGLIEVIYDIQAEDKLGFAIQFSRTVLGVAFTETAKANIPAHSYCCVVGEQCRYPRSREVPQKPPERIYMVLDEADCGRLYDLLVTLITLKDQYLAERCWVPMKPESVSEVVARQEGFSRYNKDRVPQECRKLWPSFVDLDTVAVVDKIDLPAPEAMHSDLEVLLDTYAKNPNTGQPLLDGEARPIPRLLIIEEGNNERAQRAIQRGASETYAASALWLALMGLEKTRPRTFRQQLQQDDFVPQGSKYTGY